MKCIFLMRLLFFVVLFPHCARGMDNPVAQPPQDAFSKSIQARAQEFQLTSAQAKMIEANATHLFNQPGAQKKYILLFVTKPEERQALAPSAGPLLDSSKLFLEQFARFRIDEVNPAKSMHVMQEQVGLEIIVYSHGSDSQEEQLLFTQFCNLLLSDSRTAKNQTNLIIIAQGQNAHFVNMCSHKFLSEVDSLIYFQSPVYDWYWSQSSSSYVQSAKGTWAPANYRHLYNLYSKAYHPVSATERASGYRERQYRQPMLKDPQNVPVKNIRVIKQVGNSFEDLTQKDFISSVSLSNLAIFIQKVDQYKLNFDLLGKLFDDNHGTPWVIINHPIKLHGNSLLADFGTDQNQPYEFARVSNLENSKRQFTFEVEQARAQLIPIAQVNAQQVWSTIPFGSLKKDLDRIKKEYDSILSVTKS